MTGQIFLRAVITGSLATTCPIREVELQGYSRGRVAQGRSREQHGIPTPGGGAQQPKPSRYSRQETVRAEMKEVLEEKSPADTL